MSLGNSGKISAILLLTFASIYLMLDFLTPFSKSYTLGCVCLLVFFFFFLITMFWVNSSTFPSSFPAASSSLSNLLLNLHIKLFISVILFFIPFLKNILFLLIDLFGCTRSQLPHVGSLVAASRIQFPDQGSNLGPLHWEHSVLTTGPPGKSLFLILKCPQQFFPNLRLLLLGVLFFALIPSSFISQHTYFICALSFIQPFAGPPGFSVHGISQARILEWVAISSFRESSQPRDQTQVSCIAGRFFLTSATWEALLILYTAKNNASIIKTKIIPKSKFLEHLLCCLSLPEAQFSCALYPGL